MDKKHKGGWAELVACSWLLQEGYEVFRNVSQCGITDIIAMRNGELLLFDVKGWRDGNCFISKEQAALGVAGLWVHEDGTVVIDRTPRLANSGGLVPCEHCGKTFKKRNKTTKFCSNSCGEKSRKHRNGESSGKVV